MASLQKPFLLKKFVPRKDVSMFSDRLCRADAVASERGTRRFKRFSEIVCAALMLSRQGEAVDVLRNSIET